MDQFLWCDLSNEPLLADLTLCYFPAVKGLPALLKWGLEFVTALTIADKQTIKTAIHIHGQKPSVNKWLWQVDWTHFLEVSYFVTVVASNFVTYRNVLVLFSLKI